MNPPPIIALLTDFGLSDAYVGTMKGVILSICPAARLVDFTHAVEPQNIHQAAYLLLTAFRYFPPQTVFVAVVDPGVGTEREAVAVATDHGQYVGPDNGVFSFVLAQVAVRHAVFVRNRDYCLQGALSATFHGRDIFAPAAAHLASGVPIEQLGPPASRLVRLNDPALEITAAQVRGEVLHIDHFGNIITSIGHLTWRTPHTLRLDPRFGPDRLQPRDLHVAACRVCLGVQTICAIHPTYGAVPPGTLVALVGSSGQLEIGINRGHAARVLGVSTGDPVLLLADSP